MLKRVFDWLLQVETRFFEAYLGCVLLGWSLSLWLVARLVPYPLLGIALADVMPRTAWIVLLVVLGGLKVGAAHTNRVILRKWVSFAAGWFWSFLWMVSLQQHVLTLQTLTYPLTALASFIAFWHNSTLLQSQRKPGALLP